jgi:hypothetical protein
MKAFFLIFYGLFINFWIHDFHTSLAEVHFNAKENSLEVSIRVFTDDLERCLTLQNGGKAVNLENDNKIINPLLESYFRKNFALISPNKSVKFGTYYGRENEADATWLYFEFKDCQHLEDFTLLNTIFTDMFSDQTNLVNVIYPSFKKTLAFDVKNKIEDWPRQL